jgi:hypothetical protein
MEGIKKLTKRKGKETLESKEEGIYPGLGSRNSAIPYCWI